MKAPAKKTNFRQNQGGPAQTKRQFRRYEELHLETCWGWYLDIVKNNTISNFLKHIIFLKKKSDDIFQNPKIFENHDFSSKKSLFSMRKPMTKGDFLENFRKF